MPDWQKVYGSSNVIGITYDEATRECCVMFTSGAVYLYENVSPEEWASLQHASSKGSYVNLVLRRSHTYERIS